jgi:hypothetical protein
MVTADHILRDKPSGRQCNNVDVLTYPDEEWTKDVDIVVHTKNLILEYDGSWHHRDRQLQDKKKSELLRNTGWEVIRVRERPLRKIHKSDILFSFGDLKDAVDKTLQVIAPNHPKLKPYLRRKTLANLEEANRYISELLEKTNKTFGK